MQNDSFFKSLQFRLDYKGVLIVVSYFFVIKFAGILLFPKKYGSDGKAIYITLPFILYILGHLYYRYLSKNI